MKKHTSILIMSVLACFALTACGQPGTNSSNTESSEISSSSSLLESSSEGISSQEKSSSETTEITFPHNEVGKTEYSAEIFEIEPFILKINLPEGWKIADPQEKESSEAFSPVEVYYGDKYICTISYNIFELYEDTTEENFYRSVYNQLMLGSVVNWNNNYTPIKTDDISQTATCDIMVRTDDGKEITFPGILAYNKETLTYISISFENSEIDLSEDTLKSIAESIEISR